MGIRSALGLQQRQAAIAEGVQAGIYSGGATDISKLPFASPWSTSNLERWAYQEWFGDTPANDRATAMSIPALARARNLMCISGGKLPLVELEGTTRVPDQPYWITHTPDGSTPLGRLSWTIDDLIFYGMSLWYRADSGTPEETRQRINQEDWELDRDRREVLINGDSQKPEDVILFVGLHEGILQYGAKTIRDTTDLYANVSQRIANPIPGIDLHQVSGPALTQDERDELLDAWRAARLDKTKGGVAYSSPGIEVKPLAGGDDSALMIGARNASSVDCARLVGVSAGKVDASGVSSTLTYETKESRNDEFVDFDLDLYIEPILARLSLDDVCAPGRRIAADTEDFTALNPAPTGPALED